MDFKPRWLGNCSNFSKHDVPLYSLNCYQHTNPPQLSYIFRFFKMSLVSSMSIK